MSKQIIDWQKDGVFAARGSGRGSKVHLEQVSLQAVGENADGRSFTLEEALHSAVAGAGLRGEVTVIATREIVEVRTIQVPRIDPDELPDVIRFQAQRQLSNMTDSWTLDFVMLPPAVGQEMQTALVGAISPAHLAEIDRMCAGAGLTVGRVLLRPIEIARFAVESGSLPTSGAAMIVCVSEQNAELLILRDGHVVQVRGTRLPSESELIGNSLKGEIRRSLMAASPQLGNTPLSSVLLISTSGFASQLDGVIAEASGAAVTHLDPTSMLPEQLSERESLARTSGHRLTAIAGALNADQAEKSKLVDFKMPKKRPPKKKNTGRILLYGGAAALLLLGGLAWWYTTDQKLNQDIADFREQTAEKAETVEWAQAKVGELKDVQDFLAASPNWLDELTYISTRIPKAEKIIVESPTFTAMQRDGSALIKVAVRADGSSSIEAFEKSLRDENHVVQGSGTTELADPKDRYKWRAEESITIKGRGWNIFASPSKPADTLKATAPPVSEPDSSTGETQAAEVASSTTTIESDAQAPSPDPAVDAGGENADTASAANTPSAESQLAKVEPETEQAASEESTEAVSENEPAEDVKPVPVQP
jgi:Tfp pilus assembly PilM family ATPase